jgi:hypothetical protein
MIVRLLTGVIVLTLCAPLAGAVPIVDGADATTRDDDDPYSLIIAREQWFDTVDLSSVGMLQSCGPIDQFSPNPPPAGPTNAVRVQSLLIRSGHVPNDPNGPRGHAGTINFSAGVTILGVVADISGVDGWIWGYAPGQPSSETAKIEALMGIPGYGYTDYAFRAFEVSGGHKKHNDYFDVTGNALSFGTASGYDCTDDLHVLISYNALDYGDDEYFDIALSEGVGLHVGADYLGDGTTFNHVPLTPEPASMVALLVGMVIARPRRRGT